MSLLPRLRLTLARRPWLYWLFVATCAGVVWFGMATSQARVTQTRRQWGTIRSVWVASAPVGPGEAIRADRRDYPIAMLPHTALEQLPVDAVAGRSIADGEVLVTDDLAGVGDDAIPPEWVVFAVPIDGAPQLAFGDTVAVFGSGQRWCDGVVAAISENRVDVGVPPDCSAVVSDQLSLGAVVLARTA